MKLASTVSSAVALLAGIAIGFILGRVGVDSNRPTQSSARDAGASHSAAAHRTGDEDAAADKLPGKDRRNEATPREDRIARAAEALTERNEGLRRAAWMVAMQNLQPEDAVEIRRFFVEMDHQGRALPYEWEAFWKRWGAIDGAGALTYLLSEDGTQPWVMDGAGKALFTWGSTDPDRALAWLSAHQDSPIFESAFGGFISGLALTDVARGTRAALEFVPPEAPMFSYVMNVLAEGSVQQGGLPKLLDWFDSLPEDADHAAYRKAAVSPVVDRLQHAGLEHAKDWLASKAATPWRSDGKIGEVADSLATADPAGAMGWLSALPPSPTDDRYPGMSRVVRKWAAQDKAAFEEWLLQPKSPSLQDQALAAYARQLAATSPDAAALWSAQIKDPRWLPTSRRAAPR